MTEVTFSSREANQFFGKLKRAADSAPVTITDRGKKAYVLMRYEDYERRTGAKPKQNLFDLIGENGPEHDFEFDPPKMNQNMGFRIPDFDD